MIDAPDLVSRLGLRDSLYSSMRETAEMFADAWRKTLSGSGFGELYTQELRTIWRGGNAEVRAVGPREPPKSPSHFASAPGEPPAKDTGDLMASIRVQGSGNHLTVGSDDIAAVLMEFGVSNHPARIIVKPRPHARPTLDNLISRGAGGAGGAGGGGALSRSMFLSMKSRAQERGKNGRFSGGYRAGTSFAMQFA